MVKAVTLLSSKVKMMQSEATRELLKAWCLANGWCHCAFLTRLGAGCEGSATRWA